MGIAEKVRKFGILFCLLPALAWGRSVRIPEPEASRYNSYRFGLQSGLFFEQYLDGFAKIAGWEFEWVPVRDMSYDEALHSGVIDFAFDVTRTAERERNGTLFSSVPMGNEYIELFAQEGDSRFCSGDLAALDGATVGYLEFDPLQRKCLEDFEREHSVSLVKKGFPYGTNLNELMRSGEIDLRLADCSRPVEGNREKSVYNMACYQVYFACVDPEIKREMDAALGTMLRENFFYRYDVFSRIYGIPTYSYDNFTEEERDFIRKRQTVTIVSDVEGIKAFDDVNEKFWGKISDYSGLLFSHLSAEGNLRNISGNTLGNSLGKGALGYTGDGIFKTVRCKDASRLGLAFTNPCRIMSVRLLCRKGVSWESLMRETPGWDSGKMPRIAITGDIVKLLPFFGEICIPFEFKILESVDKCLEMTRRGEFDAALVDDYFLQRMNDINNYPGIEGKNSNIFSIPICFGVRVHDGGRDVSALVASVIDKTMYQLPHFYYGELMNAQGIYEKVQPARIRFKLYLLKIMISICLLLFLLILVGFALKARKFRHKSYEDELTGLLNNDGFLHAANRMLDLNPGKRYVVTELNVRNFSMINQINSSDYGDRMLVCIADELSKLNRGRGGVLARGFADSFYIMHEAGENMAEDSRHMQHLWKAVQAALSSGGYPAVILGGCAFSGPGSSANNAGELLSRASYARKTSGSGFYSNFTVFDEQIRKRREIVLDIESCIDEAFERNEFFVVFQPKISLADGKVKGAEALVRWNSSLHGFVNPSVFIPVFEQSGYVTRLDFFVYQKVFEYQQEQIQQGRPVVPISVNVSRLHLNPEKFVSAFTSKFNQYSLTPDCVELELVERFAGASDKILIQLTELLRGAGFKVNMDDFGSGESSLNMLSEIPVDVIKFDQRFLRQAQTSKDSLIILSETMNMVRKLGKLTVCEGVETEDQVEMLRSMDCDLVQGFFYSKPLSKDAFTGYVARNI